MADDDPSSIISQSSDLISSQGFGGFMKNSVLGGIILAGTFQIIGLIQSAGSTIMAPFRAFGEGIATFIEATFGGPPMILDAGAATAIDSIRRGLVAELGIFAYPVSMVAVMLTLYVFAEGLERIDLSPWNFLRELRR